jgi:tetratricopeptide (TPR) repeat protein
MSTQPNFGREKSFVPDLLPWLIAAGALLVYLFTLNHWVTLGSLNYVSQVAGWSWPQNMLPPLYFVATFPLRWLPAAWLPVGLNLFSAVCAALTLAQLARSVALLPHDRTQAQREREHSEFSLLTIRTAWLPMVFAVLVCGLQLTFWENAVAASGEMLDILLFAYIVRCLLEYRIDGRESRLLRAALIYGAAMSNNWLMGGFLPVFVAALLWVKKLSFFNIRFLLRIAGLGLAGMLFYLLMPLVQSHGAGTPASYWDILHYNLAMQKNILVHLPVKSLWILGLTSLLPLLVLSIRWASSFGDSSPLGVALASFMFHLVHGMFLFACLWVAFDPPFSPRIFPRQYHYGALWLPLYYLGALCLGYYSGYFLLIFGKKASNQGRGNSLLKLINAAVLVVVWLVVVVATVGLLYKNLPQIQALNRDTLRTYASLLVKNLPPKSALVLADNPQVLLLAEAALPHTAGSPAHVFLSTATLPFPAYHRFLEAKYPATWKNNYATNQPMRGLPPGELIRLLTRAAETRDIYYLHPSFGYYFEQFYPEAHGLAYKLNIYPTNAIVPPPPSAENIAENLAFWQRDHAAFFTALDQPAPTKGKKPKPGFGEAALNYFQLRREPDLHQLLAGIMCARALDWWGVMLQQNQKLTDAAWCFQRAHEINPDNVAAEINLVNNQTILQTGSRTPLQITEAMEAQLRKFQNWDQTLNANGPLDEAQYCFEQGRVFAEGRLYRQAAQYLLRAKELAPNNVGSYLWLAQIYNLWHQSDKALDLVRAARKLPAAAADPVVQDGLISVEAAAYFNKNKPELAGRILETALAADPKDENLLNAALRLYISYGRFTNALAIVERQLQTTPDSATALNNQGFIYLQLRQYQKALTPLDHLLSLDPSNPVGLLNRAIARLQSDQLDGAKQDYEALQILSPKAFQVYYGLGEIAYRQKDNKTALANYQTYLSNAPPVTAEWKTVSARVAELKSGPP